MAKTFDALVRAGGPEHFVREAAKRAAQLERERWLEMLEQGRPPDDATMTALYAEYIRELRRQLGIGQPPAIVREQTRERVQRLRALGDWGEQKAVALLTRAGFSNLRQLNNEFANHPFGDICAERDGARYLIGVKTRNKYQVSGLLNPTYNVRKRGADVGAVARRHKAILAWVAIPVIPEEQTFSAFFGTIAQIEDRGERFSIPMRPEQTARYECLSRPPEEFDASIRPEWSNGGYPRPAKAVYSTLLKRHRGPWTSTLRMVLYLRSVPAAKNLCPISSCSYRKNSIAATLAGGLGPPCGINVPGWCFREPPGTGAIHERDYNDRTGSSQACFSTSRHR